MSARKATSDDGRAQAAPATNASPNAGVDTSSPSRRAVGDGRGAVSRIDEVGLTLLRAASTVLAAEGPHALTVRRIASEAGVSTMNVYSRFGGKDGVVEHLFTEGFNTLGAAMAAVPTTDDPMHDLSLCGVAYRRFAADNPTLYSVMFDRVVPEFEPTEDAKIHAGATLELMAGHILRAMDAGVIARADPFTTAAAMWAACHGVTSLQMKGVGPTVVDWENVYDMTLTAIINGLSAVSATASPAV